MDDNRLAPVAAGNRLCAKSNSDCIWAPTEGCGLAKPEMDK